MDFGEILKLAITAFAGVIAALVTSGFTRKSQRESASIELLNRTVDQLQEERDSAIEERDKVKAQNARCAKQISEWRRYSQRLRAEIYRMGGEAPSPEHRLDL